MNSTETKTKAPCRRNSTAPFRQDRARGLQVRQPGLLTLAALVSAQVVAFAADPPPAPPASIAAPPPGTPRLAAPARIIPPAAAAGQVVPTAAAAAPTKPSGAKIVFATPNYDFGKVTAGDPVNYTFYFTNVGTTTLELASVQPSCGCTTAGEWSKSVEPGKSGSIPIRFNSPAMSGPVAKSVTVRRSEE